MHSRSRAGNADKEDNEELLAELCTGVTLNICVPYSFAGRLAHLMCGKAIRFSCLFTEEMQDFSDIF